LLSHYSQIAAEHLDKLDPEERKRVYKTLDLKVLAQEDGNLEVRWVLGGNLCRDNEHLPRSSFESTTPALRFRAVITGDGGKEVVLVGA
jgi:hypothetical protein